MTKSEIIPSLHPGYWISLVIYFFLNTSIYFSYKPNSIDLLLCSLLHLIMVHFLIFRFSLLLSNFPKSVLHPFNIFILIHIIYFSTNHFKYYTKPNYYEFTTNIDHRLLGTLLVFLSLNILIYSAKKIYKNNFHDFLYIFLYEIKKKYFYIFVNIFSLTIGILILGDIFYDFNYKNNNIISLLINTYPVFLLLSLFSYKNKKSRFNIFVLTFCIASIFSVSGTRHVLLISFLIIILFYFSSLPDWKITYKKVFNILIYIPLVITVLIIPLTEFSKKKNQDDLIRVVNRGDLSDFAISVGIINNQLNPLHYITNSFKWAIPGYFLNKRKLEYSDDFFLKNKNWRSSDYRVKYTIFNVDYPDSLFSTGAFIGSYAGIVFFPPLWLFIFYFIFKSLNKICLISSFLAIIPYMFKIEVATWAVIPLLRNYLVLFLTFYLTLRFFSIIFDKDKIT